MKLTYFVVITAYGEVNIYKSARYASSGVWEILHRYTQLLEFG